MLRKIMALIILVLFAFFILTGCKNAQGDAKQSDNNQTSKGQESEKDKKKSDKDKDTEDTVPVEVTQITSGSISQYQLYNSTIEAENAVDVYTKVSGIVMIVKVEESNSVVKDQLLAKIEDEDYRLEEAGARASYEKSKRDYERSEKMYKDKLLSDNDYEQVKYNCEQTRISWERARVRLSHTEIKAPISGVISLRNIKYGDFININAKVFSIVDINSLITRVYIPEKDIANIHLNQSAVITSDALDNKEFEGKIKIINPVVDPSTGTVKVTISLKGYGNDLKPGMFVKSHIITDTHNNALLIVKKAVLYNGIQSMVFVAKNGIANQVILDVGFQNSEKIEVVNKDLKAGDKIIIVGQYGLKDKAKIKIINKG